MVKQLVLCAFTHLGPPNHPFQLTKHPGVTSHRHRQITNTHTHTRTHTQIRKFGFREKFDSCSRGWQPETDLGYTVGGGEVEEGGGGAKV